MHRCPYLVNWIGWCVTGWTKCHQVNNLISTFDRSYLWSNVRSQSHTSFRITILFFNFRHFKSKCIFMHYLLDLRNMKWCPINFFHCSFLFWPSYHRWKKVSKEMHTWRSNVNVLTISNLLYCLIIELTWPMRLSWIFIDDTSIVIWILFSCAHTVREKETNSMRQTARKLTFSRRIQLYDLLLRMRAVPWQEMMYP